MAIHVRPGQGVWIGYFWPLRVLTPRWLDESTGRFARRVDLLRLTRSYVILSEDVE